MKRLLVICLLLLVIFLSFSYVILKSSANGSEQNYFNQKLRPYFSQFPWMRSILNLHFDGDGRADYLGSGFEKILIEVDVMDTLSARVPALQRLASKIEEITGKKTSYIISDREVSYDRELDREAIRRLVEKYRDHKTRGDTATLYMLYGSRSAEKESLLGQTFEEYGIIIFAENLAEKTGDDSTLRTDFEFSTALHEFGHQLGFAHNSESGCLMNEQAGIHEGYHSGDEIIMDFCDYEKRLLPNLRPR